MNEPLLNPLRYYKTEGRQTHARNAALLFDRLVAEAGIDTAVNQAAAEAYAAHSERCSKLERRRLLFVLGCVGCLILTALGVGLLFAVEESKWYLLAGILLIPLGLVLFFVSQLPGFQAVQAELRDTRELARQQKDLAAAQIACLDRQFTERDSLALFQQTVPGFSFLERFTPDHRAALDRFGFQEESDKASSIRDTLAGTFNGNPFLLTTRLRCSMVDTTYTGSTTIHWEERERKQVRKTRTVTDRDGREREETYYEWESVPVQKSETLEAEYTAPKPCYATSSALEYGHHAAPDLSFSREPGHSQRLSEQVRQMKIRSGERKLTAKGARALKRNQDFTPMVNETFDVLFGAHDRDNSHQFLQLFTPMAQQNMVELLTDDTLCGDEFSFRKCRQRSIIPCADSLLRPSPRHYHDYSLEKAREAFVTHHSDYFRSLFGCFAPLLSIPAYQEAPLEQRSPQPVSGSNYPLYEHEAIANAIPASLAAHRDCQTETIRKTELVSAGDGVDVLRVHTSGFAVRSRTRTFRIKGGDGKYHAVDVDWLEYIPKKKTITISVQAAAQTTAEAPGAVCFHGLTAQIIET